MLVAVAGLRCLFNPSPLWKNPWIICVTWLPTAPLAELEYFTIFPCQGELLVIGLLELGLDPWTFGCWWPDKMLQASCTDLSSHGMKSWGSLCELQCGLYFWRLWCWSLLVCIKLHHAFVKVWKVPGGRNYGSHWAYVLTTQHQLPVAKSMSDLFRRLKTKSFRKIVQMHDRCKCHEILKSSRKLRLLYKWPPKKQQHAVVAYSEMYPTISQLTSPRSRWNLEDTGLHWLPGASGLADTHAVLLSTCTEVREDPGDTSRLFKVHQGSLWCRFACTNRCKWLATWYFRGFSRRIPWEWCAEGVTVRRQGPMPDSERERERLILYHPFTSIVSILGCLYRNSDEHGQT